MAGKTYGQCMAVAARLAQGTSVLLVVRTPAQGVISRAYVLDALSRMNKPEALKLLKIETCGA